MVHLFKRSPKGSESFSPLQVTALGVPHVQMGEEINSVIVHSTYANMCCRIIQTIYKITYTLYSCTKLGAIYNHVLQQFVYHLYTLSTAICSSGLGSKKKKSQSLLVNSSAFAGDLVLQHWSKVFAGDSSNIRMQWQITHCGCLYKNCNANSRNNIDPVIWVYIFD